GGAAGAAAAGAAEAGAAEAGSEVAQQDLGCESFARPVLDWAGFKGVFAQNNWYQGAVDVAYGPELERGWREAALECPLGFTVANLIKAMLCAHTESICFRAHAVMIEDVLSDIPLHAVASSGWPVLRLIFHLTEAVRRHHFKLDFEPAELLEAVADRIAAHEGKPRTSFPHRALGLRIVYATMAYGASFSPYVGTMWRKVNRDGADRDMTDKRAPVAAVPWERAKEMAENDLIYRRQDHDGQDLANFQQIHKVMSVQVYRNTDSKTPERQRHEDPRGTSLLSCAHNNDSLIFGTGNLHTTAQTRAGLHAHKGDPNGAAERPEPGVRHGGPVRAQTREPMGSVESTQRRRCESGAYGQCVEAAAHCIHGEPSILNKFTLPLAAGAGPRGAVGSAMG
ncbi:unnamed protein product, partial [Prorocentrum cordatum]